MRSPILKVLGLRFVSLGSFITDTLEKRGPIANKLTHSLSLFRPSAFPSMWHGLIRLQPEGLTLSGLPTYVVRVPAAPFTLSSIQRVCHRPRPWLVSFSLGSGASPVNSRREL
jgi:hypothetical protein